MDVRTFDSLLGHEQDEKVKFLIQLKLAIAEAVVYSSHAVTTKIHFKAYERWHRKNLYKLYPELLKQDIESFWSIISEGSGKI